jgi:hypothetical protein
MRSSVRQQRPLAPCDDSATKPPFNSGSGKGGSASAFHVGLLLLFQLPNHFGHSFATRTELRTHSVSASAPKVLVDIVEVGNRGARRNLVLLEAGQEAALLGFLVDQCPAEHGAAPTSGARLARRTPPTPVSGVNPLPTAAQFAKLEEQVKEMRRYFKQYVKTEARKRERAARVLQACVLGAKLSSGRPPT